MAPVANCLGCAEGYGRHAIDCKHNTDTKGGMMNTNTGHDGFYTSPEINAVCEAVIAARRRLGIPTIEVLALTCQRFGETVYRTDFGSFYCHADDIDESGGLRDDPSIGLGKIDASGP